jgi:membrane protease YdiL (CAAX protease family)
MDRDAADTKRSSFAFFALVFALSAPFWLLAPVVKFEGLPDNLPVTDIGATFVPMIAGLLLVYREEKTAGVTRLLRRTFDFARIRNKLWLIPIIGLMPLLYLLTNVLMRAFGLPVPAVWSIPLMTPLIFIGFFLAAAGEELGYTGYITDVIQERRSALATGLIIGVPWALWHYPSMIRIGQGPALMAWGTLVTVAFRVLYIWLYNNTGKSLFAVILFHAISNTGRSIFPGGRSHFELANAAVGYLLITSAAIVVTCLWGSKTLAIYRFGRNRRLTAVRRR